MTVERCDVLEISTQSRSYLAVAWMEDGSFDTVGFQAGELMYKLRQILPSIDDATKVVFHPMESLSTVERRELISAMWIPPWARGASLVAQRLAGLIEAAIAGRPWAMPFVFEVGTEFGAFSGEVIVEVRATEWSRALGEAENALADPIVELDDLLRSAPTRRWFFNT